MKIQVLLLAFALVAVISAAPIENSSSEDAAEDIEDIDPTQYEELLEAYLGEELLGTGLENGTLLDAGPGLELSVNRNMREYTLLGKAVEDKSPCACETSPDDE